MTMTMNTVKLSRKTFDILKNFATINSNLYVTPGNTIKTLSPMKNIMAEVVVDETFDSAFGIWDMNKFLGTISLFDDPDMVFDEKSVTISGNGSSVRYHFSDPSLLLTPTQELKMPEPVVKFELTQKRFAEIQKAASVLQVPDICVRNEGDQLMLVALDKSDKGSNSYSINLGSLPHDDHDFEFYFKVENVKILAGDYTVKITEKIVSEFCHTGMDLKYWIAMESDSKYTV
jgi:hypothetical protein